MSNPPPERIPAARSVLCPRCGTEVRWTSDSPFRPFCSERCKLIDLGQWATERYRIAADPESGEAGDTEESERS
jgi:uncharacterized protein